MNFSTMNFSTMNPVLPTFYQSKFAIQSYALFWVNWQVKNYYLVQDMNSPIYFHIHECFFNKIWCYDYFNDALKYILKPSICRKCCMISIQTKQKWINILIKKIVDWWIGELMSRTRYTLDKFQSITYFFSILIGPVSSSHIAIWLSTGPLGIRWH